MEQLLVRRAADLARGLKTLQHQQLRPNSAGHLLFPMLQHILFRKARSVKSADLNLGWKTLVSTPLCQTWMRSSVHLLAASSRFMTALVTRVTSAGRQADDGVVSVGRETGQRARRSRHCIRPDGSVIAALVTRWRSAGWQALLLDAKGLTVVLHWPHRFMSALVTPR